MFESVDIYIYTWWPQTLK